MILSYFFAGTDTASFNTLENRILVKNSLIEKTRSSRIFLCLTIIKNYNYNIIMDGIIFEWDPVKAELNYTKHKVTFEEAKSVFYDENAILIADPDHSSMDEDRFIMLGLSSELHMLVVCHCYRENDRIRIISARKADMLEAAQYGGR